MSVLKWDYECLTILYQEKNITSAARKLGIQQSGLSKLLVRVEKEIGKKLFARTKKGLIPTPFVDKLVKEIKNINESWNDKFREITDQENEIEGRYRLGCHPIVLRNHLIGAISEIFSKYPNIAIDFKLMSSSEVVQSVVSGQLDMGIVANPIRHPELVIEKLVEDSAALFAYGSLSSCDLLFYNPEMIQIPKILGRLKKHKLTAIKDYGVIYELLKKSRNWGAILPTSMIEKGSGLKQVSQTYYVSPIALVYRYDLPKTAAVWAVLNTFKGSF